MGLDFYEQIAQVLQARRVGRQQPIANDTIRSSQMELLLGDSGWVEVKDNGLFYGFDACKVMYSSGNVTERHRMGSLNAEGEIIVDAFAGIGYYSLPLLVHGKATHVHACELNPESIKALKWAAQKNNVSNQLQFMKEIINRRCPIYEVLQIVSFWDYFQVLKQHGNLQFQPSKSKVEASIFT